LSNRPGFAYRLIHCLPSRKSSAEAGLQKSTASGFAAAKNVQS
jgi:hypothetical protein